ncbi:MAG: hypothetical protein IH614_13265 [Desulfuromonadales bacterium]|nr:hypothetical protein [Desulfuromonadales bacterium]
MNGIYLVCSAGRQDLPLGQALTAMLARSAATDPARLEKTADATFCGAVMHHGRLVSGGLAVNPRGDALLLTGGSWLPGALGLSTPEEVLQQLASRPIPSGPLLRGSYLLALHRPVDACVVVETDPFGFYPVYYCLDRENNLHVASELKCLVPKVSGQIDLDALAEMLHFGSIITDRTLLTGIWRLPPHHRLSYRRGKLQLIAYPRPRFGRQREPDGEFYVGLRSAFEGYLRRFADQPELTAFLSGGLDSRLALAAARRAGLNVRAITVGEPGSLESRVAAEFARSQAIACESHEISGERFPGWFERGVHLTEGRCPPGHMHYLDRMLTGPPITSPILHGVNGDAFMGGDLELDVPAGLSLAQARQRARQILRSYVYWPAERQQQAFSPQLLARMPEVATRVAEHLFRRLDFAGDYSDLLWFRIHFRVFGFIVPCLMGQILPWSDPVVPYSDPEVFAWCADCSHAAIRQRQLQIRWGQACYPEIATMPRVKDGVVIPLTGFDPKLYETGYRRLQRAESARYYLCRLSVGRINLRRTETYPFYDQWFRRWPPVREYVEGVLLGPSSLDRGLWRREGLTRLMQDQRRGRNVWHALGGVVQAELLLQQLLSGPTLERNKHHEQLSGFDHHPGVQRRSVSAGYPGLDSGAGVS